MSDWNNNQGGSAYRNSFGQDDWTSGGQAENTSTSNDGFGNDGFDDGEGIFNPKT
ncbi:hypothetical protein FVER14953_21345 [Fusarium verticillioides]|nr:hypothetical protein FVER14953_21345 [Fusarium verticillioides]